MANLFKYIIVILYKQFMNTNYLFILDILHRKLSTSFVVYIYNEITFKSEIHLNLKSLSD